MCCPHGHAYIDNPDYDYDLYLSDDTYDVPPQICQDENVGEYEPHIIENGIRVDWRRNQDFLLVAPRAEDLPNVHECDFEIAPELGSFNLLTDGRFEVNLKLSSLDLIKF